jgi:hypothetical protein
MTMLMHTRGTPHSSGHRDTIESGTAGARLAAVKRFCMCAVAALLGGGAIAGIIALKTAAYFWRLH